MMNCFRLSMPSPSLFLWFKGMRIWILMLSLILFGGCSGLMRPAPTHSIRATTIFLQIPFISLRRTAPTVSMDNTFKILQQKLPIASTRTNTSPYLKKNLQLCASNNNNNNDDSKPTVSSKPQGVYVRPSAAIERGSGFFIPGLEGSRLRVFMGVVLLGTCVYLSLTTPSDDGLNFTLTQGITIVYALLLLWQAAVDFQMESGRVVSTTTTKPNKSKQRATPVVMVDHQWASTASSRSASTATPSSDWQDKVEWAASSFLSMTPATTMLLLDEDANILYQGRQLASSPLKDDALLTTSSSIRNAVTVQQGVRSALDTLAQSSSGRVALPTTADPPHPATQVLAGISPTFSTTALPKSIVLQRISNSTCWMVLSEQQRIEAFTSHDWKWLGQFAQYVARAS